MRRLLLTLSFFLLAATKVNATENFATELRTTYVINEQGTAQVNHEFKITNKTPLFFITQYGLKVSSNSLSNVTVTSQGKSITPEIIPTKNETSIGITFPDRVVGENKERIFTISYTNPDATVVSGKVLEVYVPKLADTQTYSSYSLTLITPQKYGEPSRIHPNNYQTVTKGNIIETHITNSTNDGVIAVFGHEQYFKLEFRYHLENPTNGVRLMQIALPPDTAYQRINYQALEPSPNKIEADNDGNWIATYTLPANVTQVVNAEASVKLSLTPDPTIPSVAPNKELLQDQEYWPVMDHKVKEIANSHATIRDLYYYVLSTLDYDYDRVEENPVNRLGVVTSLAEPNSAMCQEYTDVFITLSRAKGIPARRVTGYAYTENEVLRPLSFVQDTLHAWPEYYNTATNLWVPIDPTWEDTSGGINYFDQFDLNHIVFAYNGTSSSLPLPAGSYKTESTETKDMEVSFAQDFIPIDPNFKLEVDQSNFSLLPLTSTVHLILSNPNGQAFYNVPIHIDTEDLIDWQRQTHTVESILPFQTATLPVTLVSNSWWQPQKVTLSIIYGDQTTQLTLNASPRFIGELTNPYVLLSVGISVTVLTLGTWSVLVLRKKQRNSLRR